MAPKVVPFKIDAGGAASRFRGVMTRGAFRPGDLGSAGKWESPRGLLVPVRRVRVATTSNWSALSGTKQRNNQVTWSPVTGQHHGVHEGIVVKAANGPWFRALPRLVTSVSAATDAPASAEVVPATVSEEAARQEALAIAQKLEQQACLRMVPGSARKGLKVSSTIESVEVEEILLPVYEVAVVHHGSRHAGYVDGYSGAVHARPPTSFARIAALLGGLAGAAALLVAMVLGASSIGAARVAARAEAEAQQQALDEAARAEQLQAEWATEREPLTAALAAVEPLVAARDATGARSALGSVTASLTKLDADLDDPELDQLVRRSGELDAAITHLEAVQRGLVSAADVVGDKEKCDTAEAISGAWTDLRQTRTTDPEYAKAKALTTRLERCRSAVERELSEGMKGLMVTQRQTLAEKLEGGFLDNGLDVQVTLRGASKNEMHFNCVLMSKVMVHQLTDGGSMAEGSFLRNLQTAGVRKVVFSDTFSESRSYDLSPEDEEHGGRVVLADMGLGEKLVLVGQAP